MEVWKDVKGYDGLYQVSSLGNVRRVAKEVLHINGYKATYKQKVLKPEITRDGYNRITLSKDNIQKRIQLHRLVALHFIENKSNKPCVNHIDGNKLNNFASNLEWCTYAENENHSYSILGKINHNRKLKQHQKEDILKNCIKGVNHIERGNVMFFAEKYNVSKSTILNILKRKYYV